MSQSNPIIGPDKSGLAYRTEDNDGKGAIISSHKGATAPSYAVAGMIWLDDAAAPWLLKIYDSADWITIAAVNASTNALTMYHGTAALRYLNHAADTGEADAYAVAPSPPITAYATGMVVTLKPVNNNTGGACTINVNGLGTKNIKLADGSNPPLGAMVTTGSYHLFYDGTNFVLFNPSGLAKRALRVLELDDDYTLVLADGVDTYVCMGDDEALALTVPPNSSVAFPIGTQIPFRQTGAGVLTIVEGDGVTVNPPFDGSLIMAGEGATGSLIKRAENVWDLAGQTEGA